ncbi:MAG: hypothetical protein WCP19_06700, partial [Chloroflexota bacterium]
GAQVGRFLVERGSSIIFHPHPGGDEALQASAFLDYVMVALMRQRGNLILHANTALTPRGAVSLSGISGAGKTTTLSALLQAGCSMLADDITVLRLGPQGKVQIVPGLPKMNLTYTAAENLGIDTSQYHRHQWQSTKVIVPTHGYMEEIPAVMQALYILEISSVESVQVKALFGREKLSAIQDCIFGPMLPGEHPAAFPILSALAENVPVYRIQRPLQQWTINEVTRILLSSEQI